MRGRGMGKRQLLEFIPLAVPRLTKKKTAGKK
jgi:hypothetical protein